MLQLLIATPALELRQAAIAVGVVLVVLGVLRWSRRNDKGQV